MQNKPNKLWIATLLLGWTFDFLFWNKGLGVNFAIFTSLCVIGTFYLLLSEGLRPHRATLILLPLFGFFAAVTFTRAEPMTVFLAILFTFLAMILIASSYLGGRWLQYTLADYVIKPVLLFVSMLWRPIGFLVETAKVKKEDAAEPAKSALWPILRGLLIAIPVVAIFASLLASADLIFSQRLGDFVKLFNLERLPEYIARLILIASVAYGLMGVALHAINESRDEKITADGKPLIPAFLGFTESAIVLGSVIVLFALFVTIQFQYFFGGHANINVAGYTYSEYAVRGFNELVTTAFLALAMLLSLSAITRRETEKQRWIYSGLGVALVALLLVMLFSAYQRLNLYEAVYGFSRLRTYTHVVLYWIGLLLIVTLILEILRREKYFTLALLCASFGFAISLPLLNVDAFIVNQNIRHGITLSEIPVAGVSRSEDALDEQYFIQLSDDAIPALVSALKDPSVAEDLSEQVGASLACIQNARHTTDEKPTWQAFHWSRFQADLALDSVSRILAKYELTGEDWNPTVIAPSGREFQCLPVYMD
ncbi:MAG: DUF4173 domain-containing protein [Anaerolineales bacterium]|nr:DUF4173 domain-containing protein [Anaerolineales bacterium]